MRQARTVLPSARPSLASPEKRIIVGNMIEFEESTKMMLHMANVAGGNHRSSLREPSRRRQRSPVKFPPDLLQDGGADETAHHSAAPIRETYLDAAC